MKPAESPAFSRAAVLNGHPASPPASAAAASGGRLDAYLELTKPGITRLVTITSGVGFALAALAQRWPSPMALAISLLGCLIGTALSAAGANTLNQWLERRRDALMPRTRGRPVPTNRLSPVAAASFGVLLCWLGVVTLLLATGPAAALVSLATILLYVLVYTPLKPVTAWSTVIGAVPGAMPPLIGWCAAAADPFAAHPLAALAHPGGWSLFLLMFVWQIPHFLAIAWMYREDYALGGHRVLPVIDRTGRRTSAAIAGTSVLLLLTTLLPAWALPVRLSPVYLAIAAASGGVFVAASLKLAAAPTRDRARRVFIFSVIHLPLVLLAMVADAAIRVFFLGA